MEINQLISNVNVYGLNESIRGAKFSMAVDVNKLNTDLTAGISNLAQTPTGYGEDNWLNGVIVQFDLTFTIKAWTEAERYHFFDFVSSQSTMHKITKFDLQKAYIEYVDQRIIDVMKEKVDEYNKIQDLLPAVVADDKDRFIADQQQRYLEILYSNPCGMKLTARMTTNYRQLKTIYKQRRNHRLPEWRAFCQWIETLPHSELIIGGKIDG